MQANGTPPYSVERHPSAAEAAVLEAVHVGGSDRPTLDAGSGLDLHLQILAASRARIVASGVATDAEVDTLRAEIRAAMVEDFEWSTSPFLDLVMRSPG
jgi:hypothetical protein